MASDRDAMEIFFDSAKPGYDPYNRGRAAPDTLAWRGRKRR